MAIVPNLARQDGAVDQPFETHNRTNAGAPGGSLTPQYAGERVLDTTNETLWEAIGLTNTSWIAVTPRV